MTITDIVSLITSISALIGATVAAFWGKSVSNAKDEILKAKDAQISSLQSLHEQIIKVRDTQIDALQHEIEHYKELNPQKLREYFLSVKEQMEEYNDKLKTELQTANEKIVELEKMVENKQKAFETIQEVFLSLDRIKSLQQINIQNLSKLDTASIAEAIEELSGLELAPLSPGRVQKLLSPDTTNTQ